MGNNNYNRGASLENDVANRLTENGYAVVRAAGSGTADRDSCDVMAVDRDVILLLECKTYAETGTNVVGASDRRQMKELKSRVERPGPDIDGERDVIDALVLREKGSFSPRYVSPFPARYSPDGSEELFMKLYKEK